MSYQRSNKVPKNGMKIFDNLPHHSSSVLMISAKLSRMIPMSHLEKIIIIII